MVEEEEECDHHGKNLWKFLGLNPIDMEDEEHGRSVVTGAGPQ